MSADRWVYPLSSDLPAEAHFALCLDLWDRHDSWWPVEYRRVEGRRRKRQAREAMRVHAAQTETVLP